MRTVSAPRPALPVDVIRLALCREPEVVHTASDNDHFTAEVRDVAIWVEFRRHVGWGG